MADKLSPQEFLQKAMQNLRTVSAEREYKGLHTVYSGFNTAFTAYFDGADPVAFVKDEVNAGRLVSIPTKGGVRIYWPSEAPKISLRDANHVLAKMGL